ncbi:MAG: hypothetical protein ACNA8W_10340 [Bradymonadaceae bacterium]
MARLRSDILIQALAMPLAFAVGILFGASYCADSLGPADPADECESRVVEKLVEGPTQIVYECPPEPEEEPKTAGTKSKAREVKPAKKKTLPDAPAAVDPLERQRLLAWVRDQSLDLESCRDHAKEVYRLTVILHLTPGRIISRVDLNTGPDEGPSSLVACLRERILRWQPPDELAQNRKQLVFGLTF